MSFDLTNVNISLQQFQDISSGKYNAGEVRLADESNLKKMNNHVHRTGKNTEVISHDEVLAIKEALVKALSAHDVEEDEINRVRRELGLAPGEEGDRTMKLRSLMPLSRQQIREILDRNAAKINSSQGRNGDRVYISTSNLIYGPSGMSADRVEKRNAVSEQLSDAGRQVGINKDITAFQLVVAGNVDFQDQETRQAMIKVAREQLDALYVACQGNPRENVLATATLHLDSGQTIAMPTGKSEVAFARQLEDAIVRLESKFPGADTDLRAQYKALRTAEERQAFFAALPNDPNGGFKARAMAVAFLHWRGVTDYATLSVPNRLSDADALALARHLAFLPEGVRREELAQDARLQEMAAKRPYKVKANDQAYVPATSPEAFNKYLASALTQNLNSCMPWHRLLIANTMSIVRGRLGAKGMPDGTNASEVVKGGLLSAEIQRVGANGTVRITEDSLREIYLSTALKTAAMKIVGDVVKEEVERLGGDRNEVSSMSSVIKSGHPEFTQELMEAESPAEAEQVVDKFREVVRDATRLRREAGEARVGFEDRVRGGIAAKLGIPPETIGPMDLQMKVITAKADGLLFSIATGEKRFAGKAEYEKAFNDLADGIVAKYVDRLDAVDALDLPQEKKDLVKVQILTSDKAQDIDPAFLAAEADKVDPAALLALLRAGAPKDQIYGAMAQISEQLKKSASAMYKGRKDIGPDDIIAPLTIMMLMVAGRHPELERLVVAFFERPEVADGIHANRDFKLLQEAESFKYLSTDTIINPGAEFEAGIGKKLFIAPRHAAAFNAAGGAERAAAAGYLPVELPMLAQAFVFYKEATGCSDAEAIDAVLDPQSRANRLLGYGGRFAESAADFAKGLRLMERYETWFAQTVANANAGNFTTTTERYLHTQAAKERTLRGVERFLFEDIALNKGISLDAEDPEDVFGMANNRAMRFVGRGYTSSCVNSLAQIPPEKRGLLYDVMDILDPLPANGAKANGLYYIQQAPVLVARVMKNYDAVARLKRDGDLDRAHLVPLLFGDFGVAADATNPQINDAFHNRIMENPAIMANPLLVSPVHMGLMMSGATFDEVFSAVQQGNRLPNAPGISSFTGELTELDGTPTGGRDAMVLDLRRPSLPKYSANQAPAMTEANVKFTVRFPDGKTLDSETDRTGKADGARAVEDIADKIEDLCGKVHPRQLSAVYFSLSQSAVGQTVKNGFLAQGIVTNEHMPLTYALAKDDATGAITVTYSEPAGFPVHFHWTSTITLDGTVTSTPMVVEV